MKTGVQCLSCYLKQASRVARVMGCSQDLELQVVQGVAGEVGMVVPANSPPQNAEAIYRKIAEISEVADPYLQLKQQSNEQALSLLTGLRAKLDEMRRESSAAALLGAMKMAIAGNIIDYGALDRFDIVETLERCLKEFPVIDHSQALVARIEALPRGAKVLYLADNCGEIVLDRLLLEELHGRGADLTVAVKDGPIINDALEGDAKFAGLDTFCTIVSNGTRCPGTVLPLCPSGFRALFHDADLVISKGQGNFESLSEEKKPIFFLLTLKCRVAAEHMAALNGLGAHALPGRGEMAIYYSGFAK